MENLWNIYPRPQLVRDDWLNLNGQWQFNEEDSINVPFCPESSLSGINREKWDGRSLVYTKKVTFPQEWHSDRRIRLHFGGVDQEAQVYVNGEFAGEHYGGYLPWNIDITDFLKPGSEAEIKVVAHDELNHKYPWGKQKLKRGGMWYTPVSGIWKSVWAEPVPEQCIESLKIDTGRDWVEIRAYGIEGGTIELLGETHLLMPEDTGDSGELCASIHIDIMRPHLWSPEDPYLYEFEIRSAGPVHTGRGRKHTVCDKVKSYFALRTLSVENADGYRRLCLNGKPYFFNGLLDQGYWQDGIYTPEAPYAFEKDIAAMKSLGFNTLRKHIKIEHEQFYYDCDRLGMIVFQDMVNNGEYSFVRDTALPAIGFVKQKDRRRNADPETRRIFLEEMEATVKCLYNHPSICCWTVFNEGWGQFCADEAYDRLKELDSVRFIDTTSGWFAQNRSDVDSRHVYFRKLELAAGDKPLLLSECGGYSCRIEGHTYDGGREYGYGKCKDEAELLKNLKKLYDEEILPLAGAGLCGAIYTQVSDVEDETNGLLTYDRAISKIKSYTGTGRVELLGNHTDHQNGRVLVTPTSEKIRAYVADNHQPVIRVNSEGFEPFEVSITGEAVHSDKGTAKSLVVGILSGFGQRWGYPETLRNGCDCYIKSEIGVGSGLSSSAAFEVLMARIINERFYSSRADAMELAEICHTSEQLFYGKPCGLMDQLAVSLGTTAMFDFSHSKPEIELLDYDWNNAEYELRIVPTASDHEGKTEDYASVAEDMAAVAEALGIRKLGSISKGAFLRKLPELEAMVEDGELNSLQLDRARHFYDENERVLAGFIALKAGNFRKFIGCVDASGRSSENLLRNIIPEGQDSNELSRTIQALRSNPNVVALKVEGGGYGGSVLTFER